MVDETHALKFVRTATNRAVLLLKADFLLLISGSPIINKPIDYSKLIYRSELSQ